jgi:hypothetical protein
VVGLAGSSVRDRQPNDGEHTVTTLVPFLSSFASHPHQQSCRPRDLGNVSAVATSSSCTVSDPARRLLTGNTTEPSITEKSDPEGLKHRRLSWLFSITGETLYMFLSLVFFYVLSLEHRQYP